MNRVWGRIERPTAGETVSGHITVVGRVSPAALDRHLWIVNRCLRSGVFWPKEPKLAPAQDGSFEVTIFEGGAPGPKVVSLLAVDEKTSRDFERWLEHGHATNEYKGLHPLETPHQDLDQVDVIFEPRVKSGTLAPDIAHARLVREPRDRAPRPSRPPRVFVVHGHALADLERLELTLRRIGAEPVILERQPPVGGPTIIESLETSLPDADAVVCLLTPDDEGRTRGDATLELRARQNVLIEAGYALVSRRTRTLMVTLGNVAIPSDLGGITGIQASTWTPDVAMKVARSLANMGLPVDPTRA